ncbi:MAG: hypothetical protein KatS3mg115_1430 [Candidatus Poribacteria bacterium]|nr:MAG: hypothetical protein KatS3mg115_1430 [Candidatus Poribacteria bacterium]
MAFRLLPSAPEQPWVAPAELLGRVPGEHPRLLYPRAQLEAARAELAETPALEALIRRAERLLDLQPPKEPTYDRIEDPTERRMAYTEAFREFRRYIDGGMEPLAMAFLLTGERRFGEVAARILVHVAQWDPEGISSILAPYGDEIGLSLCKCGARAYDWLYELLSESERETVRRMVLARGNQMLRRLKERHDFLAFPGESHAGRLPGYLCEHAIALAEEPDAERWLDYALRALMTVFPHWGGPDGGWAEGINYGRSYNTIFLLPFESVRRVLGVDLWQRPFFRKVRYASSFYCSSPRGEVTPFGDGETSGNGRGTAPLMGFYANRFGDPVVRWWSEVADPGGYPRSPLALIEPDRVRPEPPPEEMPPDAVFRGVGWAALHGELSRPDRETLVLFKSSPYGSTSHSHADQNTFAILKGGRALATPSGYYGPSYGMPHHARYTRQTKAHCGVLVEGEGQLDRSEDPIGKIVAFSTSKRIGYVAGDATDAYGGRLSRYLRHVVLVRPNFVVILDDLEAPESVTIQWLLHALEPMGLEERNGVGQSVQLRRGEATLTFLLETPGGFHLSQTDRFDVPYNEGNPPAYHREVADHYHFAATTRERTPRRRIAAFGWIQTPEEEASGERLRAPEGWVAVAVRMDGGTATAAVRLRPEAPAWEEAPDVGLALVRWTSETGEEDSLRIG